MTPEIPHQYHIIFARKTDDPQQHIIKLNSFAASKLVNFFSSSSSCPSNGMGFPHYTPCIIKQVSVYA